MMGCPLPEDVEDWMADCAAVLYTQPSEMDRWTLETLYRWYQKAIARNGSSDDEL